MEYRALLSAGDIRELVSRCADRTTIRTHGLRDVFICMMNGGVFFFADLMRTMVDHNSAKSEVYTDSMRVKSYSGTTRGGIEFISLPTMDLNKSNVWIVDEFVDSGATIRYVTRWVKDHYPRVGDINVISLLKREGAVVGDVVDRFICGMEVGSGWLHGYGMDMDGRGRHLPYIVVSEGS